MNEEILGSIEDLGLSEKEARVYVANLMLGPSTVQKISDQADIKRVTTYVILESLSNLGLVSQSNQGKKTLFTAEDPITLRRLLDRKEQQVQDQKMSLESILPELAALKNLPIDSPSVKFYDTAEGIRSISSSIYEAHRGDSKIVYGISNLDQLHAFFPEIKATAANPERIKHKMRSKFIYTSTRGPIYRESDQENDRDSRYVPPGGYPINGDITIIGNHVIILALTGAKPVGITIDSEQIVKGLIAIFELAWQGAEKYNSAS